MKNKILFFIDTVLWKIYYHCGNIIHDMRQKYDYIEGYDDSRY